MQRAAVGRIVHVQVDADTNRGQDFLPAVITHVCEDNTIDVHVLAGEQCYGLRGIQLLAERPTFEDDDPHLSALTGETLSWWPPRS